jgi:hypothetical protein
MFGVPTLSYGAEGNTRTRARLLPGVKVATTRGSRSGYQRFCQSAPEGVPGLGQLTARGGLLREILATSASRAIEKARSRIAGVSRLWTAIGESTLRGRNAVKRGRQVASVRQGARKGRAVSAARYVPEPEHRGQLA